MKRITRLTEDDLMKVVEDTITNVLSESINSDREIQLAQRELYKISSNLSSIGLRPEGTPFQEQYKRIFQDIVKLNKALINHIKGGRK